MENKKEYKELEQNILNTIDLFNKLHKGEQVICTSCGNGIIKPMSNRPIEEEFCFECNNCKAHFRYDPVNVIVE